MKQTITNIKNNIKKTHYYHITHLSRIKSIIKNGLVANADGVIFVFDNFRITDVFGDKNYISDLIAHNQIGLRDKYAMFEIDIKGIMNKIIPDNVAETSSAFQYFIRQSVIRPEFIALFGTYKCQYHQINIDELIQKSSFIPIV